MIKSREAYFDFVESNFPKTDLKQLLNEIVEDLENAHRRLTALESNAQELHRRTIGLIPLGGSVDPSYHIQGSLF